MTSFFTFKKNHSKTPTGSNISYTSFGFKKDAEAYINPHLDTNKSHSKGIPGGCWQDDQENELDDLIKQESIQNTKNVPHIFIASKVSTKDSLDSKLASSDRSNLSQKECSSLELINPNTEFLNEHAYENKVVGDIILPGGMRLKQSDANLNVFCTTCENLKAQIIGSLLISKTTCQINWISKARALYAIEVLAKKFDNYSQFFKHNIKTFRGLSFGEEEVNNEQLRKILDGILNYLEEAKSQNIQQKKTISLPLRGESASTNSTDTEEPPQNLKTVEQQKNLAKPAIYVKDNMAVTPSKFASAGNTTLSNSPANSTGAKNVSPINQSNMAVKNLKNPSNAAVNTNASNMTKLPLNEVNSLTKSLSDLDFANEFTPSPYNIYQLYQNRGVASFDTFSPAHFQANNRGFDQASFNQNMQYNGQGHHAMNNRQGFYQSQQQNMMNSQSPIYNGQAQQQGSAQSIWQDPSVFNQDSGIDYDAEETKRLAKQAENEKKFDNLDFKF